LARRLTSQRLGGKAATCGEATKRAYAVTEASSRAVTGRGAACGSGEAQACGGDDACDGGKTCNGDVAEVRGVRAVNKSCTKMTHDGVGLSDVHRGGGLKGGGLRGGDKAVRSVEKKVKVERK